jgi:hypothetical protein
MWRKVILIHFIILLTLQLKAQSYELGSWNSLAIKYSHTSKWALFGEGQLRSLKLFNHFHYYEFKGGLEYKMHPQIRVALAIGNYDTYKGGGNFVLPKNNDELRIWPQLIFTHPYGKLTIEQRYRAEMRFTSNGYRNRFRYRFGLAYNLRKKESTKPPLQIYANNELFFTNNTPYFERNRSSIGVQYKATPYLTLQIAYLHQFDYQINDETGRDFFQIGFNFDLKNKKNIPVENKEIKGDHYD